MIFRAEFACWAVIDRCDTPAIPSANFRRRVAKEMTKIDWLKQPFTIEPIWPLIQSEQSELAPFYQVAAIVCSVIQISIYAW
jgi:hypothetical protein